jgi:hypothetical protein
MMRFDPLLVGNIFKEISNVGGYPAQGVGGAGLNAAGHRRLLKLCPHGLVDIRLAETVLAAVLAITKKLIVRARLMSANDPKRTSHHSRNEPGMGFFAQYPGAFVWREPVKQVESGAILATVDFNTFKMACLATQAALRHLKSSRPMSAFEVRADMQN